MFLQFTKFWRFSSDDFKVTLPKKLVKLKSFHEFVKVWRFFLRHFSWNQRKFSQFFSPLFSRFIYVANKLVKLKGFPGFVYILQKFDEFFVTFFVKPKEVCIFTNFLCRFSRFIYIAKKFVKLKDIPDLFTFCKTFTNFLWHFLSNQRKFTFSRFFLPIFKVYLHCQKTCQIERTQRLCLHLQKFHEFLWRFLEEHFESSRISSSSSPAQVTLVSATKTLWEIKSTAIDTCLTDRRNEGQKEEEERCRSTWRLTYPDI